MKRKRFANYFIIMAILILSSACNDAFLEKFPETDIGAGSFFNNEGDLNMAIYKLYDFPSTGIYTADAATDNAWTTGNTELKTMMISNPTSATLTSGWTWEQVRNCNFFLQHFRQAKLSEDRLKHFEGLGRFFRARAYVVKVKRYSDVPWVDRVVTPEDKDILFARRDTRDMVVGKILEDYEFAINNIDESAAEGSVTRWLAKADFARFLLYEGTFRKYHPELNLAGSANDLLVRAAKLALDIIEKGPFTIHNTGKPMEDYGSLFANPNLGVNKEVIFARYYQANLLNGDSGEGVFGNYEYNPVKDMLQSYLMKDGTYYSNQQNYQTFEFLKEFENRDPRLYQTYAYPGWVLVRSGTYSRGAGVYVQQLANNFSGYHQIKGFYNSTNQDERNNMDVPIYRLAETLLIYAEARAELGQLTQSDLDISINKLRKRAGLPDLTLNPPVDRIQAAKFPNITSPQRAEILEIRRERRVELAFEGFRHDDLMRWEVGKLVEKEPQGIYFSRLGKHDLNGDGVPDIILLPASESIPSKQEKNSLGIPFIYYRVGTFGQDVSLFLSSASSGNIQVVQDAGTFTVPKYYYRPIPRTQTGDDLNPNLKQIFGWE